VISKLLERLVARQFVAYLNATRLLPTTQSGFRPGHSTETAITRVLSDLLDAVDRDNTAILVLLDLSAAFDTVDHGILLKRLQVTFVDSVSSWMSSDRLQLNADKTEVMWCTSTRKLSQRPNSPLPVAGALVQPVDTVQDLGVHIDSDLCASTYVRRTVSRCFAALRQLRHLRRYVNDDCFRSLVVSLVHSRLDYGNFSLVGLPAYQQRHLASVLNAAACLVYWLRR